MKITYFNTVAQEFKSEIDDFIVQWNNSKDYITVFTSGSTGVPKEIKLKKEAMIRSAKATGAFFEFNKSQTLLLALSPKYIAGMMQIVRAIVFEMTILVAPLNSNPLLGVNKVKIDFAAFVPLQIQAILKNSETKQLYGSIPNVIIGGAQLSENLVKQISELVNENYASFGMTETITHIALKKISQKKTHYEALSGVKFSNDSRGCLVISAPHLSKNKIITNDCIEIIDSTKFNWLGRFDHVINSGGLKIHPEILEDKLKDIIGVKRFYIIGAPHDNLGEQVVLVIEGTQVSEEEMDYINTQIKAELTKYEVPKRISFMNVFDETATGKLIKVLPMV